MGITLPVSIKWGALSLLAMAGVACAADPMVPRPKVIPVALVNPGFENRSDGWSLPDGYSVVPGAGRKGGAALVCVRPDPAQYTLASQALKLKPSTQYTFGGWVKTEGVKGPDDAGAKFCVEFSHNGKFIGGDRGGTQPTCKS